MLFVVGLFVFVCVFVVVWLLSNSSSVFVCLSGWLGVAHIAQLQLLACTLCSFVCKHFGSVKSKVKSTA